MTITLVLHDSWVASSALAELLVRVRMLEAPAPAVTKTVPPPGDDGLAELVAGMEGDSADGVCQIPEPAPTTPWKPALATPETRRPPATPVYDGVPRTGRSLYKWACSKKVLPQVNAWGKEHGCPRLVSDWSEAMVAGVYTELAATPAGNGRQHERSR